jgi:hypothetical protein
VKIRDRHRAKIRVNLVTRVILRVIPEVNTYYQYTFFFSFQLNIFAHAPEFRRVGIQVPSSEEMRASYYTPAPGAHYSPPGSGILPSHYPHLASPITPQSGPRRPATSTTSGTPYSPYPNLSVQVPLGSNSYGHHPHTQHADAAVLSGWTPSVDSVRDSVSPYSRPGRQPSGSLTSHHTPPTPFAHSVRNGQLMSSPHYSNSTNAAHHHQPGTMQYNAQGRPLAYMLVKFPLLHTVVRS